MQTLQADLCAAISRLPWPSILGNELIDLHHGQEARSRTVVLHAEAFRTTPPGCFRAHRLGWRVCPISSTIQMWPWAGVRDDPVAAPPAACNTADGVGAAAGTGTLASVLFQWCRCWTPNFRKIHAAAAALVLLVGWLMCSAVGGAYARHCSWAWIVYANDYFFSPRASGCSPAGLVPAMDYACCAGGAAGRIQAQQTGVT